MGSMIRAKGLSYRDVIEQMLGRVSRLSDPPAPISHKGWQVLREVQQAREDIYRQIEELAQDEEFRRKYRDAMLCKILKGSMAATRAGMGNIQIFDPHCRRLMIQVQQGFEKAFLDHFAATEVGHAACGAALQIRSRVIVKDVTSNAIFEQGDTLEVLLDSRVRAVQSTPLIGTSGELLGVLSTHWSIPHKPTHSELASLDYFAAWAGALIEWDNAANGFSSAVEFDVKSARPPDT